MNQNQNNQTKKKVAYHERVIVQSNKNGKTKITMFEKISIDLAEVGEIVTGGDGVPYLKLNGENIKRYQKDNNSPEKFYLNLVMNEYKNVSLDVYTGGNNNNNNQQNQGNNPFPG